VFTSFFAKITYRIEVFFYCNTFYIKKVYSSGQLYYCIFPEKVGFFGQKVLQSVEKSI